MVKKKKYKIDYTSSEKSKNTLELKGHSVEGDDVDDLLEGIFKKYTDTYVIIRGKNFELISPDVCITGHIVERRGAKWKC